MVSKEPPALPSLPFSRPHCVTFYIFFFGAQVLLAGMHRQQAKHKVQDFEPRNEVPTQAASKGASGQTNRAPDKTKIHTSRVDGPKKVRTVCCFPLKWSSQIIVQSMNSASEKPTLKSERKGLLKHVDQGTWSVLRNPLLKRNPH